MKNLISVMMMIIAAVYFLSGCGKKIETVKEINGLKISASSTLDIKTTPWNHHPVYLMDGNPATAWQEGDEKTHGEGTTITIDLDKPIGFNILRVVNGFAKFESYAEENAQFKDIEISAEVRADPKTKKSSMAAFKKVVFVKDAKTGKPAPLEEQIKLDKTLAGDRIIITLKSVHPGTKYKDTCLSEIKFGLEAEGKTEIFPNRSTDYINRHLEEFKTMQAHNWVFYGLKETTKNSQDCNDLRFMGNDGFFALQIYHNGTVGRTAATGYDKKGSYREFLPALSGSFTVESVDAKGVMINVKTAGGVEENWLIARVISGDDNWNAMKTEFGTEFNRMITPYNSCPLVKLNVRGTQKTDTDYSYYTYLSPKFDCNANCGTGK